MIFARRTLVAASAIITVCLLAPGGLRAEDVPRTVQQGQSLSLICKDAYGDAGLYEIVSLYNGIEDPTRVAPGHLLRLPYAGVTTLGKGQSLSALASRVWGDPGFYTLLVWANEIKDPSRVPAGTRLTVPFLFPYRLKRGESVSAVAERFYGDPRQFHPILTASAIADPARVAAGSRLLVPYVLSRPAPERAAEPSRPATPLKPVIKKSPPAPAPKEDPQRQRSLALLDQAETAFRSGQYGDAWTMGNDAAKGLDAKEKARALRLLAAGQYAFGRMDNALADLKAARELDPDFKPDPAYVNPEMMALYERARGK
ncbi:MAG: LysM peptidoglycan-binding domain-containing protein [bacterium]|nr:LysM peptidoglycan-binding domain-containing protein [bacterium]